MDTHYALGLTPPLLPEAKLETLCRAIGTMRRISRSVDRREGVGVGVNHYRIGING